MDGVCASDSIQISKVFLGRSEGKTFFSKKEQEASQAFETSCICVLAQVSSSIFLGKIIIIAAAATRSLVCT